MLQVNLAKAAYPIYIGQALFTDADIYARHIQGKQVLIVSNTTVAAHYLPALEQTLADYDCHSLVLPDGEEYKTLATVGQIFDKLLSLHFNRQATLIALGGGVIGDMTGFAAACYVRGIAFIQIPTTVLAQVDASVGGKTGVNHPLGKNMIGAFHQPQAVVLDLDMLKTLPDREYRAGLAEIVKHGLIKDAQLFADIEQYSEALLNRDYAVLQRIIQRSCEIKAAVVVADEREQRGERILLNFGHTFAHAIETLTDYKTYLHGEAVAIGMINAANLSQQLGLLDSSDVQRIRALLEKLQLPVSVPNNLTADAMIIRMQHDKKQRDSGLQLIVLASIGQGKVVENISSAKLQQAIT